MYLSHTQRTPRRPRQAFTLVELLVVIGIIIILLAILLPAAGKVRIQAQTAKTQANIASIASAIERYYQDEHAYPGLFTNDQLQRQNVTSLNLTQKNRAPGSGTEITQTENMVMGLIGGPEIDPAVAQGAPTFGQPKVIDYGVTTTIGKGPVNFSTSAQYQSRKAPYIDGADLLPAQPYTGSGYARGAPEMIGSATAGIPNRLNDSTFPEFYDAYSVRRPIIFMRANVGATNICSKMGDTRGNAAGTAIQMGAQYMSYELNFYRRGAVGNFPGDFQFGSTNVDFDFYPGSNASDPTTYLTHPSIVGSPRGKDKFILISAGADRVFGTTDDIFYGGN